MINIRTLRRIAKNNNDGLTLKKGKPIQYKSGYQVATAGVETCDINEVRKFIKQFNGDCGLWYSSGLWYIDSCKRVSTKREAIQVGKNHNQQSVLRWRDKGLVWL